MTKLKLKKKRQNTALFERIGNEINKYLRFLLIYALAIPKNKILSLLLSYLWQK